VCGSRGHHWSDNLITWSNLNPKWPVVRYVYLINRCHRLPSLKDNMKHPSRRKEDVECSQTINGIDPLDDATTPRGKEMSKTDLVSYDSCTNSRLTIPRKLYSLRACPNTEATFIYTQVLIAERSTKTSFTRRWLKF